jgi:hypothetical protein
MMRLEENARMTLVDRPAEGLKGMFRDVLRAPDGQVLWDRGWRSNAIVADCRRVLAGFLAGAPTTTAGIKGLWVGAGLAAWDATSPPLATPAQTALVDPHPFLVPNPGPSFEITYLDGGAVSAIPTNRLQIKITLGPNVPLWPDANHTTSALREFGLVAHLNGADVLLNYVTHLVINKDPASTLERTIWLVF